MAGKFGGTPDDAIQVLIAQGELDRLRRYGAALLRAYEDMYFEEEDLEGWGLTDEDIELL